MDHGCEWLVVADCSLLRSSDPQLLPIWRLLFGICFLVAKPLLSLLDAGIAFD